MIDGITAYTNGTTKETLTELAAKHGFVAYVVDEHKNELDVIFERENLDSENVPDYSSFDPQIAANAFSMLDEIIGSGTELRCTQVLTTRPSKVEPIFNGLDLEVEYETRY